MVPPDVIAAIHALGLDWHWPERFVPKLSDLELITGPKSLGTIDTQAVDDATLEYLRFTPNVTFLDLMSSRVTDEGLKSLRHVPLLENLWLNNTAISDSGVRHLVDHVHLKKVVAHNAGITIEGERWLRAMIPGCYATIGRRVLSGRVIGVANGEFVLEPLGMHFGKWTVLGPPVRAIILDSDREKLAEFVADPIGRIVQGVYGEADEPNLIRRMRD